jgi:hypothetical protein
MCHILIDSKNTIGSIFLAVVISLLLSACGGSDSSSPPPAGSTDLTLTLPLKNYSIDADSLKIDSGSGVVHASIGPFGAHFGPLTGHTWGDAKGNIIGYFARSLADLTPLPDSNANGLCDPAEFCGFDGGTNGASLLAMQPTYIAPVAGKVTWVSQDRPPGSDMIYLNGQPHWHVEVDFNSRYRLSMGHLGSIAPALHDKVLAATGIDTDTYTAGDGVNLLNGIGIDVAQGEELAHPQLVASELAGQPGFYKGGGASLLYPWSQIEFTLIDSTVNTNACYYDLLSAAEKTSLSNAMIIEMQSTTSPRYDAFQQLSLWKWGAEAILCSAYSPGPDSDFSDIHTHLGGWVERASPGVTRDELFSIVPIQTTSVMYDASNYQPGVTHLVVREILNTPNNFNWSMPDVSAPADIYYPAGEVLEETANSLLIMWRDFSATYTSTHTPPVVYQRVAFQLNSEGLKVKWGNFGASPAGAMQPVLGSDACNDTDVICYYHRQDIQK